MTFKEFIKQKVFGKTKLIYGGENQADIDRMTFINNNNDVRTQKLREYNVWYTGDGDELLNYYTYANTISYNYEPYYDRNKRNYFWAINSTEEDIKRTHSGQPRNIIDTLVGICRFPTIRYKEIDADGKDVISKNLSEIISESGLQDIYKQEQLPLTLVEGWGCYKIRWNDEVSDYPLIKYYKAADVDFVYQNGRIIAILFKDYYTGENGEQYLLIETRQIKYNKETKQRDLQITFDLFRAFAESDSYMPVNMATFPELGGVEDLVVTNFSQFLAVPCIIYKDTSEVGAYGRSIFTGKIDLFDDLDQCLSQAANSVRKSTPIEYFNSEFLERDRETGMPIQPHAYDRKYTVYNGLRSADGDGGGNPVQLTQPQIVFNQYSEQGVNIMLPIINGIMSPATMGIDIAKKDNAEAQREKEKVTIFTRNGILDTETEILKSLCSQLLCAYELKRTGEITTPKYEITVKFSEFADDSFENKLEKLGEALSSQLMSPDMYMEKLYGNSLPTEEYDREKKFIMENNLKPRVEGMTGMGGGGANMPGIAGAEQDAPTGDDPNAI